MFIGATGTGKTFKLVELLKLYEKYDILDSKGNKLNMCIVLFCTTANSKANAVYNVLHIPEEDVILKYSDDKLEVNYIWQAGTGCKQMVGLILQD